MIQKLLILDIEENYTLEVKVKNLFTTDTLDTSTFNKNTKLYFLNDCNIPRFKVREKYTITIKPIDATHIIYNSDSNLEEYLNLSRTINVTKLSDKLLNFIFEYYTDKNLITTLKSLTLHFKDVYCSNISRLLNYVDFKGFKDITDDDTFDPDKTFTIDDISLYAEFINTHEESINVYLINPNSLLHTKSINVIHQNDLLNVLNVGNVIINADKYVEISNLLNSDTEDNQLLAMELIANSDYSRSLLYILLLFKTYSHVFCKHSKQRNQINFKSLMDYLEVSSDDIRRINTFSIEFLTAKLKKYKQFTRTNVEIITKLCSKDQSDVAFKSGWVRQFVYVNSDFQNDTI